MKSFYCILNGTEIPIVEGSINWALDEVEDISISVPAEYIDLRTVRGLPISIYKDGILLESGFVIDRPALTFVDAENYVVELKVYGELGRLSCIGAKSNAHYQDQLVTAIIDDLLTFAPGWVRINVNFPTSPTEVTTIDLRSKETIFGQLVDVIKAVPGLHLRFGGYNALGERILHVGEFGDILYNDINILEMSLDGNSQQVYKTVNAFGGLSQSVRVDLQDALNDPRTAVHPDFVDYPIVIGANGQLEVDNLAMASGCGLTKKFELMKTENSQPPTAAEIREAGFALWRKAVRFLQSAQDYDLYSLTTIYHDRIRVGDRLWAASDVYQSVYNEHTLQEQMVRIFTVNEPLLITKVSLQLGEMGNIVNDYFTTEPSQQDVYQIEVTNGSDTDVFDSEVELYTRLDRVDEQLSADALQLSPLLTVEDTHITSVPADCTATGGPINGKLFTFLPPVIPSWATTVNWAIQLLDPSDLRYTIIQQPSITPLLPLELCVRPTTTNWGPGPATPFTIRVLFFFS